MTHGAVSHQIKSLEARFGVTLFRRVGHSMQLTLAGEKLVHRVRHGLLALDGIFEDTQPRQLSSSIAVSMLNSFATHWLAPRLCALGDAFPDVTFSFHLGAALVDPGPDAVDASLRFGRGGWSSTKAEHLFDDYVLPVCAPGVAAKYEMGAPSDVLSTPMLGDASQAWSPWLAKAGVTTGTPVIKTHFDDSGVLVSAAKAGSGVALARLSLVTDALQRGSLVAPFSVTLKTPYRYYFVRPASTDKQPTLDALRDWIAAEGKLSIEQGLGLLN